LDGVTEETTFNNGFRLVDATSLENRKQIKSLTKNVNGKQDGSRPRVIFKRIKLVEANI
jgi:hypothetical protein